MPETPPDDSLRNPASSGDGFGETSVASPRNMAEAGVVEAIIGRYHLLQMIGEGGMGEVWLAEQKEPVRRRVALKVIKAGMHTREVVARFESERQALALMDHPAIAKVYDAGSTPQGRPYFVMEYVAGVPITEYCDNHKLNTRERLELFMHVCEGVQHAHQKAIIHRDLKPSNILVSEIDGRPAPKIIDFGVAKALSQRLTENTMFTRIGVIIGTPEYMSPEQANSAGEDIDTRTDVYSLGVILYELLVGAPPLELKKSAYHELLRKLREEDAPKPSTKLRTLGEQSTLSARNRGTELVALTKQLRGDLDSITLKSLEKDRSRRYGSPSELSADIARFLKDEPVLATPPSTVYRVRKFAQRNRALIVTLCGFAAVLLLAAGISVWQAVRARQAERVATMQRDRADEEAATAKAVNDFLQEDLLSQASPDSQVGTEMTPDPDVKVRTLVDRAAARIPAKFGRRPLVESAIRETIGNTYRDLGLYPQAEDQLRKAYDLSRRTRGPEDAQTLEVLGALVSLVSDQGKLDEALRMRRRLFGLESRKFGPQDPRTVVTMQSLGVDYLLLGQHRTAEPLLKKALAIQSRTLGYDNLDTLNTSDSLATLYINEGKYSQAEALLTKGLASYRRVFGREHPYTEREIFGLGRVLFGEGNYPEAEKLVSEDLASNERLEGAEHPNTLSGMRMLGSIYAEEGKLSQATDLLEKAVGGYRKTLGTGHPETLVTLVHLASAYEAQGQIARAESVWKTALQGYRHAVGDDNPDTVNTKEHLAENWMKQGRNSEAEPMLRECLALRKRTAPDGWRLFRAESLLGASLANLKRYAEAEPMLLAGYEGMKQREEHMPAYEKKYVKSAGEQIVELYAKWAKPAELAQWRQRIGQ